MARKITPEMIRKFNDRMEDNASKMRLFLSEDFVRIIINDPYLEPQKQKIHPKDIFFDDLNDFFAEEDVEILYTDTKLGFQAINTDETGWVLQLVREDGNDFIGVDDSTQTTHTVDVCELKTRPVVGQYIQGHKMGGVIVARGYANPPEEIE